MIKIKNKELKKPIFQGGMGVGVSLSGLAGVQSQRQEEPARYQQHRLDF